MGGHGVPGGLAALLCSFSFLVAYDARAGDMGDPTRGRIDGDVTLVVGAGGVVASRGPRAEVEARIRYLDTAGIALAYEDGSTFSSAAEPSRVLAGVFELR